MTTEAVEVTQEAPETVEQMEARVKAGLTKEFEERFEIWKAKELANLAESQEAVIKTEVQKLVKEYQDKQKPLEIGEIQKLVEQEYAEVTLQVKVRGSANRKSFTIGELPQSVERKFYKQFVAEVKKHGTQMAAIVQANMDESFEKILENFLDGFDGAFPIMAEATAIILNPFDEDKDVTAEWVSQNISSNRQLSIIMAQVEVNRLRDFFSRVFRSGQQAGTILTNQNYRSLLAR